VAGFDNIGLAALGRISLTTVSQPLDELARLGIELVVGRATGAIDEGGRVRLTVPTELVVRTSTARPRSRAARSPREREPSPVAS
jgi:DNA-binding LacI/PurR family transcriptional regulator